MCCETIDNQIFSTAFLNPPELKEYRVKWMKHINNEKKYIPFGITNKK